MRVGEGFGLRRLGGGRDGVGFRGGGSGRDGLWRRGGGVCSHGRFCFVEGARLCSGAPGFMLFRLGG